MAEPEDFESLPTQRQEAASDGVPASPVPKARVSDSAFEGMLGAGAPLSQGWQPPAPEELQRNFPQFEIGEVLGRGGMGAVYKGWQRSLDRFVAIKILPLQVAESDTEFAGRFKREAKSMARLKHPGIVAVYDAGETPEGLLYFIMEYVEGTDVQRLVTAQDRLPPAQALGITARVCDALAYAHEHGIIHRDIKPSNIMIESGGVVKVADFGVAKTISQDSTLMTRTNVAMGTPAFMAPEALDGHGQINHRVDLYAVGVMLYQMLTGKLPHGRFEPPSRCVPGLDTRLDRIVDRALQEDRGARYSSAVELRADVEAVLARIAGGRPSLAAGGKRGWPMVAWAGPGVVAIAGVAAALLHFAPWKNGIPATSGAEPGAIQLTPVKAGVSAVENALLVATQDQPFVNSLGMKFVPVPIIGGPTGGQRVLFSVWDTRVEDYTVFVKDTKREWPKPDFEQGPTHPAVYINWEDPHAFCRWLTGREQAAGRLPAGWSYRLPSDHEWSCAAEIGAREDAMKLPTEKSGKIKDIFPWGAQWPPPAQAGNYAGEELRAAWAAGKSVFVKDLIVGYNDGFVNTSPVGSFAANRFGLFDMGGNLWQWCEDWIDQSEQAHVLRGGSWCDSDRDALLSSYRRGYGHNYRNTGSGFRCVLAPAQVAALKPGPIKLWNTVDKMPADLKEHWSDGVIALRGNDLRFDAIPSRDGVMRAAIRMNSDMDVPQIHLREKLGNFYRLAVKSGPGLILESVHNGQGTLLKIFPFRRSYREDEWATIELRAVGDDITVSLEGQSQGTVHDSTQPQAGRVDIYAGPNGTAYFRDIIYVPLDNPNDSAVGSRP